MQCQFSITEIPKGEALIQGTINSIAIGPVSEKGVDSSILEHRFWGQTPPHKKATHTQLWEPSRENLVWNKQQTHNDTWQLLYSSGSPTSLWWAVTVSSLGDKQQLVYTCSPSRSENAKSRRCLPLIFGISNEFRTKANRKTNENPDHMALLCGPGDSQENATNKGHKQICPKALFLSCPLRQKHALVSLSYLHGHPPMVLILLPTLPTSVPN